PVRQALEGMRKPVHPMIPIAVLGLVFCFIAFRQIGRFRFQIWQIMLAGAMVLLATNRIPPAEALHSIQPDVMLFLFGMFVVGEGLEKSGYLALLAYRLFRRTRTMDGLVLLILFTMGFASAVLMNDTLAVIGTPVVLLLAARQGIPSRVLLLALAFSITIGSTMSPIGNPQNLLIAVSGGVPNPFLTFSRYLLIPTVINLLVAFAMLRWFYRDAFQSKLHVHTEEHVQDADLGRACQVSLALIFLLIPAKILILLLKPEWDFRLTWIALAGALPLLLHRKRLSVLKEIDWHTLVFFAAMFVVMQSVWNSGFFQSILGKIPLDLTSLFMILAVSVLLSQFVSNVPLVALYLPLLLNAGATPKEMIDLAAGSTIAGNLLILGAASNVIIIQAAERKAGVTITFFEFARIGIPLTLVNVAVYAFFLNLP
ncbi:MAG TPA: SLC13 family permease, partial [Syntrophales bacterium]|nr:SLC13 family permease [Syntrophales bacterium]